MDKQKFTKDMIIKSAAKIANKDTDTMRSCYQAVEKVVREVIASTELDNPLSIKICDGISIDCKYIPTEDKKNNLTGKIITVDGHIKPKFNITRSFIKSINSSK